MLILFCAWMLIMSELTIEEHEEWRELANMMQNVAAPPEAFFQTFHATDQVMFILI